MLCPFCTKTIDFQFLAGKWIAIRDGQEHMCVGLMQALTADKPLSGRTEAARQPAETRAPIQSPPRAPTVTPAKTRLRSGLRKLPVQLELQALD